MKKNDPFGFDMSVSSSKKKNPRGRRGMSGAFETSQRVCEAPDCNEQGQYRAPKGPDKLDDFHWFCRDHVREYNLKWNFFDGKTEAEMNAQMSKDKVWERETKPLGDPEQRAWARLGIEDPHQVLGDKATRNPGRKKAGGGRKLPPTERRALEILEAAYPVRFTQWALRPDSGGEGEYRGGLGAVYEIELLEQEARVALFGERGRYAPQGVVGGDEGAKNHFAFEQDHGWEEPPMSSKMVGIQSTKGQRVRLETPGGGGYGDKAKRAKAATEADRQKGYIS